MKSVAYCDNSTIVEAWAVLLGVPGTPDDAEVGALTFAAKKRFGTLKREPAIVLVGASNREVIPPFWREQLSWDDGEHLARIGHRYLSVHYLQRDLRRYARYETSLRKEIEYWLDAYQETMSGVRDVSPVERIGFGYVNAFSFPASDFDLSRYFKLHIGIDSAAAVSGLAALEVDFQIADNTATRAVSVNVLVRPEPADPTRVQVRTRVEALVPSAGLTFVEKELLLTEIGNARLHAKTVFFDLATEETHKLMGAHYDVGIGDATAQ